MSNVLKREWTNLTTDTKFSEIFTGSIYALGARVIASALGIVTSIIIARVYGPEMMGIVAVLNSFLTLTSIFTVLGTNTSILRLIPEHLVKYSPTSAFQVYRKTQRFVGLVSIVTGGMLFLASGFVANTLFSKPHLHFYFAIGAVFIIFKSLMDLNTQAVRGVKLIKLFAFMQILPTVSNLLILVALTILLFHRNNPVYAMFSSIAITALLGAWIMDRSFEKRKKPDDVLQPIAIKEILATSLPMLMTATLTFVIGQTGVIMLGVFRTDAEVGCYSIALKLATLTTFLLSAINSMAAPKFSELFQTGKIDELFHVARKSTKLIFWTTSPILILLILVGKEIISCLFGAEFIIAYRAMVLLVIGQFVNAVSGSTGIFMNMTGHEKALRNIIAVAAGLNILLSLALIPKFGILGAALSGMCSLALWNIVILCYIKIKYGKSIGYVPLGS